jgi:transcriptional regulator with XRE-family HTH domain
VARTARGLTLQQMQTATSVSSSYLSRLENRRIEKPGPDILAKIADAYGIPSQTLLHLAGYGVSSEQSALLRSVPRYIFEAAAVLTEDDWENLQNIVEGMVTMRRAEVPL